jgi:hypothetical protein
VKLYSEIIMKTLIIYLLCASLLLEGCFCYSTITEDEHGKLALNPDQNIKVYLKDETEIEAEPYRYFSVVEPANYVYGSGICIDKTKDSSYEFSGIIYPVSCDSNPDNISSQWQSERARRYDFYLNDGTITQFDQGDFVMVDSTYGPGLWICSGEDVSHWTEVNNMKIPFEDIDKIEVRQVDTELDVVLGVAGGIILTLFVALSTASYKN